MVNIYERFSKLVEIKGIKVADITRATGIKSTVFSEWKSGKSQPKADKLQKIADYFCVSMDFLTGRSDTAVCPLCEYRYDPLDLKEQASHDKAHSGYLMAVEKYGEIPLREDAKIKSESSYDAFIEKANSTDPDDAAEEMDNILALMDDYIFDSYLYHLRLFHFAEFNREWQTPDQAYQAYYKELFSEILDDKAVKLSIRQAIKKRFGIYDEDEEDLSIISYYSYLTPESLKIADLYMKATPGIKDSIKKLLDYSSSNNEGVARKEMQA